jgi:hypothetical protein
MEDDGIEVSGSYKEWKKVTKMSPSTKKAMRTAEEVQPPHPLKASVDKVGQELKLPFPLWDAILMYSVGASTGAIARFFSVSKDVVENFMYRAGIMEATADVPLCKKIADGSDRDLNKLVDLIYQKNCLGGRYPMDAEHVEPVVRASAELVAMDAKLFRRRAGAIAGKILDAVEKSEINGLKGAAQAATVLKTTTDAAKVIFDLDAGGTAIQINLGGALTKDAEAAIDV